MASLAHVSAVRTHRRLLVLIGVLVVALAAAGEAAAAIVVTRADLSAGQLRVEGQGAVANAAISIDGVARGAADAGGRFKIQLTGFSSPTCTIAVADGTSSASATLAGCVPAPPPPTPKVGPSFVAFAQSATTGGVGQALTFAARGGSAAGTSVSDLGFTYDWGDGSTLTQPVGGFFAASGNVVNGDAVTHTWQAAGSYTVTVTAFDSLGRTAVSAPLNVTVSVVTTGVQPGQNDCGAGADAGDILATATPLTLPVTCTGRKSPGDIDVYAIKITQPAQLLSISVKGFLSGLELYDPAGNVRLHTDAFHGPAVLTSGTGVDTTRAFGFTVDQPGDWKLRISDVLLGNTTDAAYTLTAALGGGGTDCLSGRDPAAPAGMADAPNWDPLALLLAPEVSCTGSLPAADFDTLDQFALPVVAGEPVAVAVLPNVPVAPPVGGRPLGYFAMFPTDLACCFHFVSGDVLDRAPATGKALVDVGGPGDDYRLLAATGSHHTGDCFSGGDAGDSFAFATPLSAPVCVGDVGVGDANDWYRFPASPGDDISVFTIAGAPPLAAAPTVPLELYDPAGVNRGSGEILVDQPGEWRIHVATDIGTLPHFAGAYGIQLVRTTGVAGHDCGSGGDAPAAGLTLTLPVQCRGDFLPHTDDTDDYRLSLQAGQLLDVAMTPNPLSDYQLVLTDPNGVARATSGPALVGVKQTVSFPVDITGAWTLTVRVLLGDGYERSYALSASTTTPVPTAPNVNVVLGTPGLPGDAIVRGATFTLNARLTNSGTSAQGVSATATVDNTTTGRLQTAATVAVGDLAQGAVKTASWSVRGTNLGTFTVTVTVKDASGAVLATASKSILVTP